MANTQNVLFKFIIYYPHVSPDTVNTQEFKNIQKSIKLSMIDSPFALIQSSLERRPDDNELAIMFKAYISSEKGISKKHLEALLIEELTDLNYDFMLCDSTWLIEKR